MTDATAPIQRPGLAAYATQMAVVCAIAVAAAAGIARVLGGDSPTISLAAAAVLAGSIITFLPGLLSTRMKDGPGSFGIFVVAASMARTLLILAAALTMDQTRQLVRPALWIGVMSGALIVLIAEAALSIALLARIERLKAAATRR